MGQKVLYKYVLMKLLHLSRPAYANGAVRWKFYSQTYYYKADFFFVISWSVNIFQQKYVI